MKTNAIVEQRIVDRLNAATGVDPQGLDAGRLRWILRARCRQLGLTDASEYAVHLDSDPAELDALIDQVVVQETRFFRDPIVFEHIRAAVTHIAAETPGPLRILSAPCGTGEEAYSLAATLLLLGIPAARFTIDAVDISPSALEAAQRGVYPERALQHVAPELQQAVAVREGHHWSVHESLRERVQFARRNLAEANALGDGQYQLILCRNLFIYLAPTARAALARSLSAALAPGGRLFLGTADRVEELNALFAPMRPAASFAFVHRGAQVPAGEAAPRPQLEMPPMRRMLARFGIGRPQAAKPGAAEAPSEPKPANLQAAREMYERALLHRQRGETAKAERRCRQALYLAPNDLPALELLQELWDANPNLRLRRALRDRILRHRLVEARDE